MHYEQLVLIEDNVYARHLVCEQLTPWANQVHSVSDVQAALTLIEQIGIASIGLLVIDWCLADEEGMQALTRLAARSRAQLPPVVFMAR